MTYFSFKVLKNNIGKINLEVLQALLNKLQLCQWVLRLSYIGKNQLIAMTEKVCLKVSELEFVLFTLATTFKKLFSKL